jgi:hypothetical protein
MTLDNAQELLVVTIRRHLTVFLVIVSTVAFLALIVSNDFRYNSTTLATSEKVRAAIAAHIRLSSLRSCTPTRNNVNQVVPGPKTGTHYLAVCDSGNDRWIYSVGIDPRGEVTNVTAQRYDL